MKILYFGGGLGNQIFEYFFYKYIEVKFPKHKVRGIYFGKKFEEHESGLEITKVFDVSLPSTSLSAKLLTGIIFIYKKILPDNKFCSLKPCEPKLDAIVFNAFKTDKKYYEQLDLIEFRSFELSEDNEAVLKKIHQTNSIAIHVRRGDFLSVQYSHLLANIATEEYYKSAIEIVIDEISDPVFFVFSDDIQWVKDNLNIPDATYITWNTGKDSYKDMFLMTHCKANIIANSTFSYWGAFLNKNVPLVIYPKKWINNPNERPDIFPNNWIGL